mmetsp:Transcript_33991/g.81695  ORF Transcript_33991/g.81695 Transcript_33991/m.81695 type:complete len:202 (+) Transcript_33991:1870-2475(+)
MGNVLPAAATTSTTAVAAAMSSIVLKKEMLVYTGFTVDALNTFFSFPLFVTQGLPWALDVLIPKKTTAEDDKNVDGPGDGSAEDDDERKTMIEEEVERPSVQAIWDIFMVCYEGYTGFTASTLVCIYQYPETVPIFAYSLCALYMYKFKYLWQKTYQTLKDVPEADYQKVEASVKLQSVMYFFLPCYGGYCALDVWGRLQK